jgi:hypothetical protein
MNNKWREFILGPMIHEGVRQAGNTYVVNLSDLTFEIFKDTFPNKYQNAFATRTQPDGTEGPMYRDYVSAPVVGALRAINDMKAFEQWKEETMERYGDVEVTLDPTASHLSNVKIKSDKYSKSSQAHGRAVQSYYDSKKSGDYTGD